MTDGSQLPGLHWGIKASFLDYIARMPDGQGSVSGGAIPIGTHEMVFEPGPELKADDGVDVALAFRGDVRFGGHYGMLFVRIADPWITVRGGAAELTVLDPYQPDRGPRLRLVTFTLSAEAPAEPARRRLSGSDVRLTAEGTTLFNDVYAPGEPFEPITIVAAEGGYLSS